MKSVSVVLLYCLHPVTVEKNTAIYATNAATMTHHILFVEVSVFIIILTRLFVVFFLDVLFY